ncbi:MAG: tetratricopeptide repeat protein [Fimbriimonadales bacterium]|nr:tetratricopeptide repeat protein [Fimbriimonadales bacterium]
MRRATLAAASANAAPMTTTCAKSEPTRLPPDKQGQPIYFTGRKSCMHYDITRWPYPIAAVFLDVDNERLSLQQRRAALYFVPYQTMRTVGLTLVGQYLTYELPPDAPADAQRSLNNAIRMVRVPHFSDWITLLRTLRNCAHALQLDFFPEFEAAMQQVEQKQWDIPREYGLNHGSEFTNLTLLEAFMALRNGAHHNERQTDAACQADLQWFRPLLEPLMAAFAFLERYELLALRSPLTDATPLVWRLHGPNPPAPQPTPLDEALRAAFERSPVVARAPDGRLQPMFPLFHAHLQGEPVHYYDGQFLLDRENHRRRTVYYLGSERRLPVDDSWQHEYLESPDDPLTPRNAGQQLYEMLRARDVRFFLRPQEVAPWTVHDLVNDYSLRTLEDLRGRKYFPETYLPRAALSDALWRFATTLTSEQYPYCAMLLKGESGCGKTSQLCELTERLLSEQSDHLVLLMRGDGLIESLDNPNLLLGNLLYKIGLRPSDFSSFAEFLEQLKGKAELDVVQNRRFVIIVDAVNESRYAAQLLQELLDLVSTARRYPWVRVVFSARTEFLQVYQARADAAANPFYMLQAQFVPPPEPLRPEDPPAWTVPPFTEAEAEQVYRRYQQAHAEGKALPACRTPWERIPPDTRRRILCNPLRLHLWMAAFNEREASPVASEAELFHAYLKELRGRFPNFWEAMQPILRCMLEQGKTELDDYDAARIREEWERSHREHLPRNLPLPTEIAVIAGVLQKRLRDEGGGYRVPFQRLREQMLYEYLKERDPNLRPDAIRLWLRYPPTDDLVEALSLVAEELWTKDRSADWAVFLEERVLREVIIRRGEAPVGVRVLERAFARRLVHDDPELLRHRLQTLLNAVQTDPAAELLTLIFDAPKQVEGKVRVESLRTCFELMEGWLAALPQSLSRLRELSVVYNKIGDVLVAQGELAQAQQYYNQALALREALHQQDPARADWARDLSVSYSKLGDVFAAQGDLLQAQQYYARALEICLQSYQRSFEQTAWAHDIGVLYNKLGDVSLIMADSAKAKLYYEYALALREVLHQQNPARADWAHDLSITLSRLGDVYRAQGILPLAQLHYERSCGILSGLHQRDPTRTDWARDLSALYIKLGDVRQAQDDLSQAQQYYEKALAIAEALYRRDPTRVDWAHDLCVAYVRLGDVNLAQAQLTEQQGDPPRAELHIQRVREYYQQAQAILERLCEQDSAQVDFWWGLVVILRRLGELTRDRAALVRARDILRALREANRLPHVQAQQLLEELEQLLGDA